MSLRARILKKALPRLMSGWADGTVAEQRARQEKSSGLARVPADVNCRIVSANGVPGEWIEPPAVQAGTQAGVILYLHGGAYALNSVDSHREWIARLARATGTQSLAINYRLAPEDPFPAALEDTLTAYRWLMAQGIDPARMLIAGDSAGGGLAAAALLALRDGGDPLPAGAILLSPWLDLTLGEASHHDRAAADPILSPGILHKYAILYAGDQDLRAPLLSPLFGNLAGLPPLLIQAGTDEVLLDDARAFAQKAEAAGVPVTLGLWDGLFHVFQMFGFLPETKQATAQIAEFAATVLASPDA